MGPDRRASLALIVRSHPWHGRAARADLDLALAAAALDLGLEVYFLGAALMQLADERDSSVALLPGGYRAWAALPDLGDAQIYAERDWLGRCDRAGVRLIMPVQPLSVGEMQAGWRRCDHVLVV